MNWKLLPAAAIALLLGARGSFAHRLDEYLQAALISVEKDHVQVSMRLVPGVAVFSSVLAGIDTNGDGVISRAEQRAYAERVLGDLSLTAEGNRLSPRLVSVHFPAVEDMKAGLGEIRIELSANLPHGGPNRRLVLQNAHQSRIAAYLMNCLVPRDPDIRIVAQGRNEQQSVYRVDYVVRSSQAASPP